MLAAARIVGAVNRACASACWPTFIFRGCGNAFARQRALRLDLPTSRVAPPYGRLRDHGPAGRMASANEFVFFVLASGPEGKPLRVQWGFRQSPDRSSAALAMPPTLQTRRQTVTQSEPGPPVTRIGTPESRRQ